MQAILSHFSPKKIQKFKRIKKQPPHVEISCRRLTKFLPVHEKPSETPKNHAGTKGDIPQKMYNLLSQSLPGIED